MKTTTLFLTGTGILAIWWLGLAMVSQFTLSLVAPTIAAMVIPGSIGIYKNRTQIFLQVRSIILEALRASLGWKIVVVLTSILILLWFTALGRIPNFDGLAFYLPFAKVAAFTHHIVKIPGFEVFSTGGLIGEMHYAALYLTGNADALRLFDWPAILSAGVMLTALARMAGAKRIGQWLIFSMIFSSSAVLVISGAGKTDLLATAFACAMYTWLVRARFVPSNLPFILTGLFAAFTVLTKFNYLPVIVVGIFVLQTGMLLDVNKSRLFDKKQLMRYLSSSFIIVSVFMVTFIPNLVKNHLLFDSAFAPFIGDTSSWLEQSWYSEEMTRKILTSYPLQLFFGIHDAQLGNLSPLVLAFIPLGFLLPREKSMESKLTVLAFLTGITTIFVWVLLKPSVFAPRYILSGLLLLCIPAAKALEYVSQHEQKPRWITSSGLIIASLIMTNAAISAFPNSFNLTNTIRTLFGSLTDCEKTPDTCEIINRANFLVSPGQRLFLLRYHRYHFKPEIIQCLPTQEEVELYLNLDSAEQQWSFIYGRGFEYVILLDADHLPRQFIDPDSLPEWLKLTPLMANKHKLFSLESVDPGRQQHLVCRQTQPLIWEIQRVD